MAATVEAKGTESPPSREEKETVAPDVQYMTFSLGEETYGIDILRVQEIRGWEAVTRVPNAPPCVKGVLNLRGAIVPVIDLRERFELPAREYRKDTVVIILRVTDERGLRIMGIVVDAVCDVLDAHTAEIGETPDFGPRVTTDSIRGLISAGDDMVMLLDVDKLLGRDPGVEKGTDPKE